MARRRIWLSYDFGITGNYDELYEWLDDHDAKECGRNIATLFYEYDSDLARCLREDLSTSVGFGSRSRIYVTYKDEQGTFTGKFIVGNRKTAPWEGFGNSKDTENDDDM